MAAPAPRDAKRACPAALEARVSTTELPGLGRPGRVYSVLAGKGEERFLGTLSALYLQVLCVSGKASAFAQRPPTVGGRLRPRELDKIPSYSMACQDDELQVCAGAAPM